MSCEEADQLSVKRDDGYSELQSATDMSRCLCAKGSANIEDGDAISKGGPAGEEYTISSAANLCKAEDRRRAAQPPSFFSFDVEAKIPNKSDACKKYPSSVFAAANVSSSCHDGTHTPMGVLEWLELEAEEERSGAGHSDPALVHRTDWPSRPPAPELLFLHKIRGSIKQPPSGAWTPKQLAQGVSRLFSALPAAHQKDYHIAAQQKMENYQVVISDLYPSAAEASKACLASSSRDQARARRVTAGKPAVVVARKPAATLTAGKLQVPPVTSASGASRTPAQDSCNIIFPRRRQGQQKKDDSRKEGVVVTIEILESVFNMPLHKACKALGVCATALKRACRKLGVKHWPYRDQQGHTQRTLGTTLGTSAARSDRWPAREASAKRSSSALAARSASPSDSTDCSSSLDSLSRASPELPQPPDTKPPDKMATSMPLKHVPSSASCRKHQPPQPTHEDLSHASNATLARATTAGSKKEKKRGDVHTSCAGYTSLAAAASEYDDATSTSLDEACSTSSSFHSSPRSIPSGEPDHMSFLGTPGGVAGCDGEVCIYASTTSASGGAFAMLQLQQQSSFSPRALSMGLGIGGGCHALGLGGDAGAGGMGMSDELFGVGCGGCVADEGAGLLSLGGAADASICEHNYRHTHTSSTTKLGNNKANYIAPLDGCVRPPISSTHTPSTSTSAAPIRAAPSVQMRAYASTTSASSHRAGKSAAAARMQLAAAAPGPRAGVDAAARGGPAGGMSRVVAAGGAGGGGKPAPLSRSGGGAPQGAGGHVAVASAGVGERGE